MPLEGNAAKSRSQKTFRYRHRIIGFVDFPNQLPHETRLRSIEKAGDTRFGALFSARFFDQEDAPLQDLQLVSPHFLDSSLQRTELRECIAVGLDADALPRLCLPLSGGGVCPATSLAEDWGAWISWPTQSGPNLMQLQRYVSSAYGADRDAYRSWISPVLEALARELDYLIESEFLSHRLSFAPEHVFTSIESQLDTLRSWTTEPPAKWAGFAVHMLPLGLDGLIPLVLGQDQVRHRASWLRSCLTLRFASLIYGMFEGKTFPEGTPRSQSYTSALLLSETGNRALRKCLEHENPTLIFPSATGMLSEALKSDAKKSQRKDKNYSSEQPGTKPGRLGYPLSLSDLPPRTSTQDANKNGASSTPESAIQQSDGRSSKLGFLLVGGGLIVVALTLGVTVFSPSSNPNTPPLSAVGAASIPKPDQLTSPNPVQETEKVVSPNPQPQPATPSIDPVEQARSLADLGKLVEAEQVLLQAADQDSGAGGRQRTLLTQAYELKSVQGAERLGRLAGSSDPLKAVEYFWQGHLWSSDPSGLKNEVAASRCLREAVNLKFGPALLEEFQIQASKTTATDSAVDLCLAALNAFDQGNTVTPKDPNRRSDVVAKLSKFPAIMTAIEVRASAQTDATVQNNLLNLASDAGSPSAPTLLAELIDGRYGNKSTIPLVDMDRIVNSLRLGTRRNSIPAMLKLAKIHNSNSYPTFTGRESQTASKSEAKALYLQAATLGDSEGQFGYAQALLSENQLDLARSKPPGDLARLQIVQANQVNLTEAYKYLVNAERNGSKGAKGVRTLVVEVMLKEAGFPLPTL